MLTKMLQVRQKTLLWAWRLYANIVAVGVIVAAVTYGIVHTFSPGGPALRVTSHAELLNPIVEEGGEFRYLISFDRLLSCPGERITVYSREDPREIISGPIIPAVYLTTGPVIEAVIVSRLPRYINPGPWRVNIHIESRCPTHVTHDFAAEFDIMVVPRNE